MCNRLSHQPWEFSWLICCQDVWPTIKIVGHTSWQQVHSWLEAPITLHNFFKCVKMFWNVGVGFENTTTFKNQRKNRCTKADLSTSRLEISLFSLFYLLDLWWLFLLTLNISEESLSTTVIVVRKLNLPPEFNPRTQLFAFTLVLMPVRKAWNQMFST